MKQNQLSDKVNEALVRLLFQIKNGNIHSLQRILICGAASHESFLSPKNKTECRTGNTEKTEPHTACIYS